MSKIFFIEFCYNDNDIAYLKKILKSKSFNTNENRYIQTIINNDLKYHAKLEVFQICAQALSLNKFDHSNFKKILLDLSTQFNLSKFDYQHTINHFEDQKESSYQSQQNHYHNNSLEWAYQILEIKKNATKQEIEKAYKTQMNLYHPDKAPNVNESIREMLNEKVIKIQEARDAIFKNFI